MHKNNLVYTWKGIMHTLKHIRDNLVYTSQEMCTHQKALRYIKNNLV